MFSFFSHYKPMLDDDAPGAWPIWAQGTRFAGIIKGLLNIDTHKYLKTQILQPQKGGQCLLD